MSIIRNADDFGKSEEVNRAIMTCLRDGYIERTTLMVNMPYADEAVSMAKSEGFSDRVGIHLNLTEGEPLSLPIRSNPLFCDENGRFNAVFCQSVRHRLFLNRRSRKQVYEELFAQLIKYKEYGLTLFHVDSHHHVHTDLPIALALKSLSKEYDFSSVRLSRNLYHGGNRLMNLYKKLYNRCVSKICNTTTDYFGSFDDFKEFGTDEELRELVKKQSLEIMLHPMYKEDVLTDTDTPMDAVTGKISLII